MGENMRGANACVFQFRFEFVVVHTHGYLQGPMFVWRVQLIVGTSSCMLQTLAVCTGENHA